MARTRSIRPEFWSDERVGSLSLLERLLFIGLWTFADDEGLCRANPLYLRSMIFPYDNTKESEIKSAIENLESNGLVFNYSSANQKYLWIIKFRVYQRIDKPQRPNNPAPSIQNSKYAKAIHKRDGYQCHLCHCQCSEFQEIGKPVDPCTASVDHIIPISKNGSNYPTNLKTACISCNKSRGNRDLDKFLLEEVSFSEHSENILGTFSDETETETEVKQKQKLVRGMSSQDEHFDQFWQAYPKKVGRIKAKEAWSKMNGTRPTLNIILSKLSELKDSEQWKKENGQYIPNPATWLNRGGWDDECRVSGTFEPDGPRSRILEAPSD